MGQKVSCESRVEIVFFPPLFHNILVFRTVVLVSRISNCEIKINLNKRVCLRSEETRWGDKTMNYQVANKIAAHLLYQRVNASWKSYSRSWKSTTSKLPTQSIKLITYIELLIGPHVTFKNLLNNLEFLRETLPLTEDKIPSQVYLSNFDSKVFEVAAD